MDGTTTQLHVIPKPSRVEEGWEKRERPWPSGLKAEFMTRFQGRHRRVPAVTLS